MEPTGRRVLCIVCSHQMTEPPNKELKLTKPGMPELCSLTLVFDGLLRSDGSTSNTSTCP
jgi:hypothetical protein